MRSQPTVSEVIADELYQAGVRIVFGQPGGEVVDLMEAMAQRGIEFVLMGLESAAALAAGTLGQATGVPGVCLATLGPGACNLTLGIGDAFLDRHPLLAISARTAEEPTWYNHQRLDLNAMFAPISKASIALDGTNTATQIQDAVKLATTSPRGPVYLSLPSHMAVQKEKSNHQTPPSPPLAPPNNRGGMGKMVKALNRAQRPIVVVGIALDQHKDAAAIRAFLAATGLPYADTPKTKGLVDPNGAGFLGTFVSASGDAILNEEIRQSDCILGIGYDPVETTYDWHLGDNYYVIADGPTGFGSFEPHVEAIGDVSEMMNQLTEQYDGLSEWTAAELSAIRAQVAAKITPSVKSSEHGLAPLTATQLLRAALPQNTHLTVDTGQHKMIFAQAWHTNQPLSYFNSNGLSSMSTSVPGAIALAHANPELPVVSVSGDGGFAMMVQELETVNRLGITPLFVVFVDQALSLIRIPQQMRGIPSRGIDMAPVDWAIVAQGFGVRGVWARTENDLQAAVAEWVDNRQAMVIAVQIDEALYCGNSY